MSNFLQTLIQTLMKPDHEESRERAEVARAANLLQVGEFQLLQLAYHDWFRVDVTPEAASRLFRTYMIENFVPHWARHYALYIIALDAAGMLNDRDERYHRYDVNSRTPIPHGVRQFCIAVMTVAVCIVGALWISYLTTGVSTSFLPPYFEESEIKRER